MYKFLASLTSYILKIESAVCILIINFNNKWIHAMHTQNRETNYVIYINKTLFKCNIFEKFKTFNFS